jgi:galactonate dehydratase
MKIVKLRVRAVRVNHRGNWLFVEVETDDGLLGLGEASHSGDDELLARLAARRLAPALQGRDPAAVEPLWRDLLEALGGTAIGRLQATALSAVEQALWDLNGQALGVPVHRLLGGAQRDWLRLYANVNRAVTDRSPAGFAAAARAAVAEGFGAVKLAPFDGVQAWQLDRKETRLALAAGLERVAAVREAIGPAAELMVDCHGRFSRDLALLVARELEPLRLSWLEEPVLFEQDPDGLAALGPAILQPLAGGEHLFGRSGFAPLLQRRLVGTIMPDVKHCGGLWEARKIAALAETARTAVSPHNPAGPLATLASAHLSATLPNFSLLEYAWGETAWRPTLLDPPETIVAGHLKVPEAPGLGARLNEAVAAERGFDPLGE